MDYEEALQEALAAVNSQQAQQQMAANIEAGNAAYGQLKDQAAANRSLERQRLAQRMADIGIAEPQPLTVQNNWTMAGYGDMGDISAQNRNYTGVQNAMIKQADLSAAAQAAGVTASMKAAENASDMDEEMSKFDRYYRLYLAKKMTRSQFKKKTGIDVRGWKKRRTEPTLGEQITNFFETGNAPEGWTGRQKYLADTLSWMVQQGQLTPEKAISHFLRGNP